MPALQAEGYLKESELTEARRVLAELRLEAERTRGRLESQAQQITAAETRITQGETESLQLGERLTGCNSELSAQAARVQNLELEVGSARTRLAAKAGERDGLQQTLRGSEQHIESCRQRVLRLLGEASTLKNQFAQINEYMAGIQRETEKAQKEEQTAHSDIEWLAASRQDLSQRMAARQVELESVAAQKQQSERELADHRARAVDVRQRLDGMRSDFSRIKARKDSLEEILSHRAYTTEAVKRLFTTIDQGEAGGLRPSGVLADFVEVVPAHERVAEEFLHDELEYVVVENWAQAEQGINLLRTELQGRATFLVHPEKGPGWEDLRSLEPPIGPETGIVARLSDVLHMTNGLTHAPAELLPRLARCFIAEDRASAQRLASQYPAFYFLAPDGVCYSGYSISGGKKTGSGPLALKRELRELLTSVKTKQAEIDSTAAELEALDQEVARLEQDVERLRALQQSQEKEALALEHEIRKLADESKKAESRLAVARVELTRLGREKERAEAQRSAAEQGIADKDRQRLDEERALEAAREQVQGLQTNISRLTEEHAASRAELAGLEERSRSEQAARSRLESQLREIQRRLAALSGELERLALERTRLLSDNIDLDQRATSLADRSFRPRPPWPGWPPRRPGCARFWLRWRCP